MEGFCWASNAAHAVAVVRPETGVATAPSASPADDDVASAARELRSMCARRKQHSAEDIVAFLTGLPPGVGAAACVKGNRNGKAALHFTAQMRPDDGHEVAAALLSQLGSPSAAREAVNAATKRGHTALIYAAGRGHERTVELLLRHGASARVMTVLGDTALKMATGADDPSGRTRRSRLPQTTLALLEADEAAAGSADGTPRPWRDFRGDADALAAQAEHVLECPCCRAKEAARSGATQRAREQAAVAEREMQRVAQAVARSVRAALGADGASAAGDGGGGDSEGGDSEDGDSEDGDSEGSGSEAEGSAALVAAALDAGAAEAPRQAAVDGMAAALAEVLGAAGGARQARRALRCCREQALAAALSARGIRDRRPLRLVLQAVLQAGESEAVARLPAADVIAAADAGLAMELLRRRAALVDAGAVRELWQRMVLQRRTAAAAHKSELNHVTGRKLAKREGGARVSDLAALLCLARDLATAWPREALPLPDPLDIVALAARDGPACAAHLRRAVQGEGLSQAVLAALGDAAGRQPPRSPPTARGTGDAPAAALPLFEIASAACAFVGDEAGVRGVHAQLRGAAAAAVAARQLLCVGMDTEWGDASDTGRQRGPAVVQLAARLPGGAPAHAWVLDAAVGGAHLHALGELLRWLFDASSGVRVLGFAFGHDLEQLAALHRREASADGERAAAAVTAAAVLDVQSLAASPSTGTPGLKHVVERWLGRSVDKTLQCSDWDARPLSAAQIQYAATDAAVLLDLADAMAGLRVGGSARDLVG